MRPEMRNPLASSSTTGTIHAFLLLLRLIVALTSYSIIHPDEYFQNPEIGAAMVFNYPRDYSDGPLKTWEWLGDAPCRGVGVVTGSTALPFWILKRIVGEGESVCISIVILADLCRHRDRSIRSSSLCRTEIGHLLSQHHHR